MSVALPSCAACASFLVIANASAVLTFSPFSADISALAPSACLVNACVSPATFFICVERSELPLIAIWAYCFVL